MNLFFLVVPLVCVLGQVSHDFRLYLAARNADFQGMEAALMNGANVNAKAEGSGGLTPVLAAAMNGRQDVVQFLLEKGADPHIPDLTGTNLWHYTCTMALVDLAKSLASRNISPQKKGVQEDLPVVHRCAVVRGPAVVPVLNTILGIKGVNADFPSKRKQITALMSASKYGNHWMVGALIKHGANVNKQDEDGRVPLSYAIFGLVNPEESDTREGKPLKPEIHRRNHLETIKLLLDNGADPVIESNFKDSPYALAKTKCMGDDEVHKLFEDKLKVQFEAAAQKQRILEAQRAAEEAANPDRRKKKTKGMRYKVHMDRDL